MFQSCKPEVQREQLDHLINNVSISLPCCVIYVSLWNMRVACFACLQPHKPSSKLFPQCIESHWLIRIWNSKTSSKYSPTSPQTSPQSPQWAPPGTVANGTNSTLQPVPAPSTNGYSPYSSAPSWSRWAMWMCIFFLVCVVVGPQKLDVDRTKITPQGRKSRFSGCEYIHYWY